MNEANFKALVSGQKRGVGASLFRAALRTLSFGYGVAACFRNCLFDRGWKRAYHPGVPVVSVGNLTTGGTGKTPVVAFLANWFREQGQKPVILSRGYRSVEGGANDEKLVLDQLCPGIGHLQNPDRVASAKQAVEEHQAQVLILDDGFQHRRLARDLDVVLVDATNPWGYGAMLPRGLLREPLGSLKRADLAVITRADQVLEAERRRLREEIRKHNATLECVEVAFAPQRLVNAEGATASFAEFRRLPVLAFCGIGNPAGFQKTLADCGFSLAASETFADHHHYTEADLNMLGELARSERAAAVFTTQKDLVKIPRTHLNGVPLWALEIGTDFLTDPEPLVSRLKLL